MEHCHPELVEGWQSSSALWSVKLKAMNSSLHYQAPTRIDFAGGTLDLWPLYTFFQPTVVVNAAINIPVQVTLKETDNPQEIKLISLDKQKEETLYVGKGKKQYSRQCLPLLRRLARFYCGNKGGLEICTHSPLPEGSGLGASSALNIGLNVLLDHYHKTGYCDDILITVAKNLEAEVMGIPTGTQDYYPALWGGIEVLHYLPEGTYREEIKIDINALEERLLLVYSHKPEKHGINNWEVYKGCIEGNHALIDKLEKISKTALAMAEAFRKGDLDTIGFLLGEEWQQRRSLSPHVSTPVVDKLITLGRQAGAISAKACGAGGGGALLFFCREECREEVASALLHEGARVLECSIVTERPTVIAGDIFDSQ